MSGYRRRGVGLSAFQNRSNLSSSYATHGAALQSSQTNSLSTQKAVFQSLLHTYAVQHGEAIKNNPTFRAEFARMCSVIGVDPQAGSNLAGKKGRTWWDSLKGGEKGDEFYVRVATRVVEECQRTRGENGGLLSVEDCRVRVVKGQDIGGGIQVTEDDIAKAVESLKPLGSGFSIITIGHKRMIRSVPKELNPDQSIVLGVLQDLGSVTASVLEDNLSWEAARAYTVLDDLLTDSLVWISEKGENNRKLREVEYWSPSGLNAHEGD